MSFEMNKGLGMMDYCIVIHQFINYQFQTLGHIFAKPNDPVTKGQRTDAIYHVCMSRSAAVM